MKLKKIIKYLDCLANCKIWINDEKEPAYEGSVLDIPWYLLELSLYNDDRGEAIGAGYSEDHSYLAIYLLEEEK